jgi:hypothetical protein
MGKKGKKKKTEQLAQKSEQCYVLVADDLKIIFFWVGKKVNARSKFIGLKMCQKIRDQIASGYKIVTQDEGYEDPNFLKFFKDNRGPGTPFPYIPNPPNPPDDLDGAAQLQVLRMKPPNEIETDRFCKHCGATLEDGVSICPNCGKKN